MAGSGVVVLGVSMDTNPKLYHDFLSRTHVSFMTARDPEAKISADYGTFKYPESYIIDAKGKVVQKIVGATNWTDADMVNAVRSLFPGQRAPGSPRQHKLDDMFRPPPNRN